MQLYIIIGFCQNLSKEKPHTRTVWGLNTKLPAVGRRGRREPLVDDGRQFRVLRPDGIAVTGRWCGLIDEELRGELLRIGGDLVPSGSPGIQGLCVEAETMPERCRHQGGSGNHGSSGEKD